jgi:hypothetical protein
VVALRERALARLGAGDEPPGARERGPAGGGGDA